MRVLTVFLALIASPALADYPVIEAVSVRGTGESRSFSVTLTHADSGWSHYSDGWEVLDEQGNVLGHRTLAHPHVNEQPFTRSLSGVTVATGISTVFVRAHCIQDGWGAQLFEVELPD